MGAVYEASHLRIPKKFAIKFLKVSLLDNSVALLRFRREAEVIATLDNPHIVSLLDYNITEDGVPYTILEYLEGEHLGDRVARGRMPLADTLRITEAISGALVAAHEKGVVHRDLKPENVILCKQGAVKVVDFGIAKLRGGQELTAFNSILGTITYMAPEQLMAGQIDARADQFALGAIAYEMLSGDMPFGSEGSIPEIAERVLRQQPAPIAGYPQSVQAVLLRAMSKAADARYASVEEFCAAFKSVASPLLEFARSAEAVVPVAAKPSPLPPTVERPTTVAPPAVIPAPPAPATPVPPVSAPASAAVAMELLPTVSQPVLEPEVTSEEGLPELPGDATSISMAPIPPSTETAAMPETLSPSDIPTGETEAPMPADTTRITQAPQETTDRRRTPTMRPGDQRAEPVTGRMMALRNSLADRLGRRGGIAVGVVLGVLIAVAASLLWR